MYIFNVRTNNILKNIISCLLLRASVFFKRFFMNSNTFLEKCMLLVEQQTANGLLNILLIAD